ncbi:TPA: hypothetical protein PXN31_001556 [Yersinia enterocolitica]|uniref:Uncharacterized protein n=1 Tax=Phytobacter palmae TaxID=1855371 RepID=A0ABU9VAX8_9ENTR|nr:MULTISPECIES: hypothetical protein [Enterobacteriaceae]EDV3997204.1 hypothetical protein [Salmonella enterica subsp. enterica serovar Mbandaka]EKJ9736406.1 hypothetical protein [Salmonella enterica]MDU7016546.1 hypothetical protein [Enterobacter sp.]HBS5813074.1 hypothetical protein [Klebsiella pneumoniae]HDL7401031.1 hypothetical protein [Yersinia enterocolitica]
MNNLKPDRHRYKFAEPSSLLWRRSIAWLLTSVATGNSARFLASVASSNGAHFLSSVTSGNSAHFLAGIFTGKGA